MIELLKGEQVDLKIKQIRLPIFYVGLDESIEQKDYPNLPFIERDYIDESDTIGNCEGEYLAYVEKDKVYLDVYEEYESTQDLWCIQYDGDVNNADIRSKIMQQWGMCDANGNTPLRPIVVFDESQDLPNEGEKLIINGIMFTMINSYEAFADESINYDVTIEDIIESAYCDSKTFFENYGKGTWPIDKILVEWLENSE